MINLEFKEVFSKTYIQVSKEKNVSMTVNMAYYFICIVLHA